MKIGAPVVSVKDLVSIAMSPGARVARTPFGPAGIGTWYIGRAVPWKAVRGLESVRAINPRVASGLQRAIGISKSHRERGVAVAVIDGAVKMMPLKSASMSPRARIIGSYRTAGEALSAIPAMPAMPAMPAPAPVPVRPALPARPSERLSRLLRR
jgi:hypothetical protein